MATNPQNYPTLTGDDTFGKEGKKAGGGERCP